MRTLPKWYGLAAAAVFSLAFWALLLLAAYGAIQNGRRDRCAEDPSSCAAAVP